MDKPITQTDLSVTKQFAANAKLNNSDKVRIDTLEFTDDTLYVGDWVIQKVFTQKETLSSPVEVAVYEVSMSHDDCDSVIFRCETLWAALKECAINEYSLALDNMHIDYPPVVEEF
jgi:hypothetical protein